MILKILQLYWLYEQFPFLCVINAIDFTYYSANQVTLDTERVVFADFPMCTALNQIDFADSVHIALFLFPGIDM